MKLIKQIYTLLVLVKNVFIRKLHYHLCFFSEKIVDQKVWYYDFKHWGFSKYKLMMVSGADELCERYSQNKDNFSIDIIASRKFLGEQEGHDCYVAVKPKPEITFFDRILRGRKYIGLTTGGECRTMWICPVTLFVLGRYPNFIYIKIPKMVDFYSTYYHSEEEIV